MVKSKRYFITLLIITAAAFALRLDTLLYPILDIELTQKNK